MRVKDAALELWPRAKVEEQANGNPGGFQIIHQLDFMDHSQLGNSLQLDDDALLDEQVRFELSDKDATKVNSDRCLLGDTNPGLPHRLRKRVLVNALKKPMAKFVVDGIKDTDDSLGQR